MNDMLNKIYRTHHDTKKRGGFAVLEKQRGELFSKLIGRGKNVLDLGCRDGVMTKYFTDGNRVTGADIDLAILEEAKNRLGITTVNLDIQKDWPFIDNSFDVVVAGELLEHLYFPEKTIEKAAAVLKKGGSFIGSVPNAFSLKNRFRLFFGKKEGTSLKDPMHINHFEASELIVLLKKYFSEVEIYGIGNNNLGLRDKCPSLFSYSLGFKAIK
jgi:2-polyprenyl-3-methyl-5-hydroxy-6-metoxy-1,4-benzoquinol methylase